jgi:multiple sugar transport system substrate-binding protein
MTYKPQKGPQGSPDVWIIRPAEMPQWASAGKLVPVPAELTRPDNAYAWMQLLPLYREQLLKWDRTNYALPLFGEVPICCYRADLYADEANRKAYRAWTEKEAGKARELKAPASWEELADQAEFFHRHDPSGNPAPSLPPLPADEASIDRLFYAVAAPCARRAVREDEAGSDRDDVFAFHYDLKTGAPRIASPGFVYALKLLKRLQAYRPASVAARPEEAFAAGKAKLCVTDGRWLVELAKAPGLREKIGICPVPGSERYFTFAGAKKEVAAESNRVPYLGAGGWLAVVARSSAQQEAAWHFLASLTGPEGSNQLVLEPRWGGPLRQGQLGRDNTISYELDATQSAALRDAMAKSLQHGLKNPVLRLRIPDQGPHRSALVAAVREALTGKTEAKAALKQAAQRWTELDRKKGSKAIRAEYRLSLGLLAD